MSKRKIDAIVDWKPDIRRNLAVEMRSAGWSLAEIAAELGLKSGQFAAQMIQTYFRQRTNKIARIDLEYRMEHLSDLADLKVQMKRQMEANGHAPRFVEMYLKLLEREAKLSGADQPLQISVDVKGAGELTSAEIQERLAELRRLKENTVEVHSYTPFPKVNDEDV